MNVNLCICITNRGWIIDIIECAKVARFIENNKIVFSLLIGLHKSNLFMKMFHADILGVVALLLHFEAVVPNI